MQIDMHYYCTFAMARAAGLAPEDSRIIATAAQFVDDNAERTQLNSKMAHDSMSMRPHIIF